MIGVLFLDLNGKVFGANVTGQNTSARPTDPVPNEVFEFDMATNEPLRLIFANLPAEYQNFVVVNMGTAQAKLTYKGKVYPVDADTPAVSEAKAARRAFTQLAATAPLADPVMEALRLVAVELGKRLNLKG